MRSVQVFPLFLRLFLLGTSLSFAPAARASLACESLFKAREALAAPQSFTYKKVVSKLEYRNLGIAPPEAIAKVFEGVPKLSGEAGRAALEYMATLPTYFTSLQKAQMWIELTRFISVNKGLGFVSEMYKLPGERYLFRGDRGETLFIDADASLYRIRTEPLHDTTGTWTFERSHARRVAPPTPKALVLEMLPFMQDFKLQRANPPLLDEAHLQVVFKGVHDGKGAGMAALGFMRNLPTDMTSDAKAQTWIELVLFAFYRKNVMFISDTYRLPDHRYLFRGGQGETLFIDSDGSLHRTSTETIDDEGAWIFDSSKTKPL